MEEDKIIAALSALAQTSRLRIFRALVVTGTQGLTPSELCDMLDIPATTLSFHLKELVNAGLISQQRNGRSLIYRTQYSAMNELLNYLTANCCQGESCLDNSTCENHDNI